MADVIEISEVRLERIRKGVCFHRNLLFDEGNQYIECRDCNLPVQPFEAFMILARNYNRGLDSLKSEREELEKLVAQPEKSLLKATRAVDSAWRRRNMIPACPHCGRGIAPEDGLGGHMVNRTIEMERRKFEKAT